ncbi:thioredoxin [Candidatus Microgenomates bacterium]|nr:thioredoxin [Candidatus Microgenomates bacterium]
MAAINVGETDFEEKVTKSTLPVLVDFWAVWCGPCRLAEPIIEELSDIHSGKLVVTKVNVDENPKVTEKYGVMSIPTTILFKGGKEVDRIVGFGGKGPFEELVKKAEVRM